MDPAQSLEILCKAHGEHAALQRVGGGCAAAGCSADHGGEALVNALLSQGAAPEAADPSGGYADSEGPPLPAPPPLPPRGQVIDLETGENELSAAGILERFPELAPEKSSSEAEEAQAAGEVAGDTGADAKLLALLTEQLRGSSPAELAREVVRLHQQRVTVHKAYDGAFQHLLNSPQGGGVEAISRTYPFVVACATARFAALSRGVRAAAGLLEANTEKVESVAEAAGLIRKVQRMEQERLQLIAASHLEQTRLFAMGRAWKDNEADTQMLRLSRKSVADVKRQIGVASEEVEETVSELRYCAADLQGAN